MPAKEQLPGLDPQQFSVNLRGGNAQEIEAILAAAKDELSERATNADDGVAYYFAPHPETQNSFGFDMDTQPLKCCEEAFEVLPEILTPYGLAPQFLRVALAGRSEREERLSVESHCQGGYAIPEDAILWRGLLNLGSENNSFWHARIDTRGLAPRLASTIWENIITTSSMRYASLPGRSLRDVAGIMYPGNRIAHAYATSGQLTAGYARLQRSGEPLTPQISCVIPPDVARSFAQPPQVPEL